MVVSTLSHSNGPHYGDDKGFPGDCVIKRIHVNELVEKKRRDGVLPLHPDYPC